ncbi:MFS transporter [Vagococcus carniphilus]|uniref:MFS transporter n=1 Tax=Vagococcus carniphilus TaxID=218144 RepID=UPI003B5A9685
MFSNNNQTNFTHQLIFGLVATFLCGLGFSIVMPVTPFLVSPYVNNANQQALVVTLLMSTYAVCVFLTAPIIGYFSDRFGRRPVLLFSLLGATLGFLIFGLANSLEMLFLGRIIEGITGGSIATIFAYFADITPEKDRTKYFGWISAVAGFGTVMGPTIGGLLTKFGNSTPLFLAASISFLNFILGYFVMKETVVKEEQLEKISLTALNPINQMKGLFANKSVRIILFLGFLLWVPNGSLQSILSQFSIDTFQLSPSQIGMVFSIIGIQDILSQVFVMPKLLLKKSDRQIVSLGITFQLLGYSFIVFSQISSMIVLFIVGMLLFGFGESIFSPAFNGLLSKSVSKSEQGKIQGGSQSIQSLARIFGSLIGGQLYVYAGHFAPAVMGICLSVMAIWLSSKVIRLQLVKDN